MTSHPSRVQLSLLEKFQHEKILYALVIVIVGVAVAIYFPSAYFSPRDSMSSNRNCYRFLSEWYDPIAGTTKKLILSFYTEDNSIEMFDVQAKKLFLKRVYIQDINEKDFYIGNTVTVLARQLKIINFADDFTQQDISKKRQKTFAMIKPDAIHRIGEVVDFIQDKGFEITQMKMVFLTRQQAKEFYQEHSERAFYGDLVKYITSGPVVALELVGPEAVLSWRQSLGPTDSELAVAQEPGTLRALYGTNKQANAAHGSDSATSAQRELNFFFGTGDVQGSKIKATAHLKESTCCIIKPHAVSAGRMGKILTMIIHEGFHITGLQMFRLSKNQAEEFLEVYKDVLVEYPRMVHQLSSGLLLVLEIMAGEENNTLEAFRDFVGPLDPEVARELRPQSLRARFGDDKVKNGSHCTDLPEDRSLEVQFFFKILQQ